MHELARTSHKHAVFMEAMMIDKSTNGKIKSKSYARVETGTRTRVDVKRVPGTAGLLGYLVFITMDVIYAAK